MEQIIPNTPPQTPPTISLDIPTNTPIVPKPSINKIYILISIVVLIIVAVVLFTKSNNKKVYVSDYLVPNNYENLDKYNLDSDADGYPDFIESEIGLNPLISEYTQCKISDCQDSDNEQTKTTHNVLIILDSSGSMGLGNPTRLEIAKQAIKKYISMASTNTNVGLMVYGQKGSNTASGKLISCASAETISPLGTLNSLSVDSVLSSVNPVGWTPMGLAIQQAAQLFEGKNSENNEIILLSDGEETCNTNPTQKANDLKMSSLNIRINDIGFAVDSSAQTQLNQISTSGGGTFSTANNLTELDQKFNDLYKNGQNLLLQFKCNSANTDSFRACYNVAFQKNMDWIRKRKLMFYEKTISQDEYNKLEELSAKLYAQQKEVTNTETQKLINQYKQKQDQL